jgi:DNA repair ATPase RecN
MLWLVAGVALVTMVLSIIISLVILGGINGTLDFNRVQAVQQLQLDLDEARESLGGLSEKVNVFDERLTPLEGLTGRISTVEDDVGVMQQDVADALAGVEQMQTELDSFAEETARLTGRVDRFDTFLEGLRRIITELFAAPSAETAPQK